MFACDRQHVRHLVALEIFVLREPLSPRGCCEGWFRKAPTRRSLALRRSGVVCSEPLLGALSATERWIRPVCLQHRNGPAADQMLLLTLYAHCVLASTVFLTDTLATEQR